jgi:hypothetical protein
MARSPNKFIIEYIQKSKPNKIVKPWTMQVQG